MHCRSLLKSLPFGLKEVIRCETGEGRRRRFEPIPTG
jgi:hypothetical protein